MTGLPSHGDDEVPTRRGLRVHHQILDEIDADVAGRLKSKCRNAVWKIQIIVDGLRHMDDTAIVRPPSVPV